jgi:hypothetical protein
VPIAAGPDVGRIRPAAAAVHLGVLPQQQPHVTSSAWTGTDAGEHAMRRDSALLLVAAAAAVLPSAALDNGLAIVPPKGWRSWNQFGVCAWAVGPAFRFRQTHVSVPLI